MLVKEAAMNTLREIPTEKLLALKDDNEIRPVSLRDFEKALKSVVASVSKSNIESFESWRKEKG